MRVIGMISGTSFDAVEAVLADFAPRADLLECELVARRSVPYPDALRDKIAAVLPPASTDVGDDLRAGRRYRPVLRRSGARPCRRGRRRPRATGVLARSNRLPLGGR